MKLTEEELEKERWIDEDEREYWKDKIKELQK